MNKKQKIVVAITGASGSIYAYRLLKYFESIKEHIETVDLVFSSNAKDVWKHELQSDSFEEFSFRIFDNNDFFAPFASGSAGYDTLIICPASMGTIGRIANGISNDLISRTADVMLKERKKLLIVPRETPFNLIHLRNMTQLTESGAVIIPASPSFYSLPKNIEELVDTVVHRIISMAGFDVDMFKWGEK
ncbi:MAG: 3-octaprenyl-4-hydroxybenzoate carboxy-lyase [Bacteroidetes bacterium]|nr:MAG: 3-octaprenyl-4-hydroxybenzoate carboxy-lyase [Bacteroidota bacterium]